MSCIACGRSWCWFCGRFFDEWPHKPFTGCPQPRVYYYPNEGFAPLKKNKHSGDARNKNRRKSDQFCTRGKEDTARNRTFIDLSIEDSDVNPRSTNRQKRRLIDLPVGGRLKRKKRRLSEPPGGGSRFQIKYDKRARSMSTALNITKNRVINIRPTEQSLEISASKSIGVEAVDISLKRERLRSSPNKADSTRLSRSIVSKAKPFPVNGLYIGEVSDGVPHGRGTMSYSSGAWYTGWVAVKIIFCTLDCSIF
jgi:hypothetical protein